MKNKIIYCVISFSCLLVFSCKKTECIKPIAYPTDSIKIDNSIVSLQEGTSFKLNVIYNTTQNVSWSSSNDTLASVSQSGVVTAKMQGRVFIVASCYEYNGASDSIEIDIIPIMEKHYVPIVLTDWGATLIEIREHIDAFHNNSDIENNHIYDEMYDIICSNSNSVIHYEVLQGCNDVMLLSAYMYVWGKPDSIIHELDSIFYFIDNSNGEYFYKDENTSTIVKCTYIGASARIKEQGILTDYYKITFSPPFSEILDGKLSFAPALHLQNISILDSCVALILNDAECWYFSNFFEADNYPISFRNNDFYYGDEILAIGELKYGIDGDNRVYNYAKLLGMIKR